MRLLNSIKTHAASMDAGAPVMRWGVVQSVDTKSMTVKVTLQPENVLTDWLPIVSPMSGNGWGMIHPPVVGTQVVCMPDAGDHDSYVVMGSTWNTAGMPPTGAQTGELWMVHSNGSAVKLLNSGHVVVRDQSGTSLEFQNNGTVLLTGNLVVTGDITDQNGAHSTMAALRSAYDAHKHTGVQAGISSTGTTDHTI